MGGRLPGQLQRQRLAQGLPRARHGEVEQACEGFKVLRSAAVNRQAGVLAAEYARAQWACTRHPRAAQQIGDSEQRAVDAPGMAVQMAGQQRGDDALGGDHPAEYIQYGEQRAARVALALADQVGDPRPGLHGEVGAR
ncbi:hypothetical protein D3C81_1322320 [compost metagenome]